ncbi:MAG TPA: CoA-binding protein [Bacteriovoracaceae bacterium]|nr:CoA-binding protein [Bacteriovoracaceae bacterium]
MEVVAVIGASSDPTRYSYKCIHLLQEYGHRPIPVHPREEKVLGLGVVKNLADLAQKEKVDTITVYVNPAISDKYEKDIIAVHPRRVIFNPGAENPRLENALEENGIKVENACTLVLLRTDQF